MGKCDLLYRRPERPQGAGKKERNIGNRSNETVHLARPKLLRRNNLVRASKIRPWHIRKPEAFI